MKRLLSFFLIFGLGTGFAASTVEHRSVSEAYVAPEINIAFPAAVGKFRKNEVSRSYNPMIGTKIRYSDADGFCADIFIYSLPIKETTVSAAELKKHYNTVKEAILGLPSRSASIKKVTMPGETKVFDKKLGSTVYTAAFQISWSTGSDQISTMRMFSCKGQIIKLRMSCSREDAELFADAILKLFQQ